MDVINIAFTLVFFAVFVSACVRWRSAVPNRVRTFLSRPGVEAAVVVAIVALAAFVRLYQLDSIPNGMNQDEASIGYDAWALWNYGIDRNGYVFPVYPVTWGAGQGPLGMYIASVSLGILGPSLFAYRLPFALLGIGTIVVLYFFLRRGFGRMAALVGIALLAFAPWHVVLSRWGLDANPLPFFVLVGVALFMRGADLRRTGPYLASAAFFSLALYVYGAAMVAVPILLVISAAYAMRAGRMTWRQLLLAMLVFFVVLIPLMAFYAINLLGLPEVRTPFFSIPRLTALRSGSVFLPLDSTLPRRMLHSAKTLLLYLTVGTADSPVNQVPGFGIVYLFTFPLTLVGLASCLKRGLLSHEFRGETLLSAWFIGASVLCLLIDPNINRLSVLFLPVVCFLAYGVCWVARRSFPAFVVAAATLAAASCLFCATYFGSFRETTAEAFQSGLGDALAYAQSNGDGPIYCTATDTNGAYVIALFYCKIPPQDFIDTVVYVDPTGEFRMARSFTRFTFALPDEADASPDAEYVVSESELDRYSVGYEVVRFGNYAVVEKDGSSD